MLIEAIAHDITFKLKDGQIVVLRPGCPVDLADSSAAQLLRKAVGKVRVVALMNRVSSDLTGHIVTWDSPVVGLLRATVLEDLGHGVRVFHPLAERECVIPAAWIRFTPFSEAAGTRK